MRKFLLLIFVSLSIQLHAQLAVKVLHFNPTGEQGFLFKKRFAAELMYLGEFTHENDNIRFRAGSSYVPLKSRLDTFPSYIIEEDIVKPGYTTYEKYDMAFFFGGTEWACLHRDPFYMYFGGDVLIGGIIVNSDAYYEDAMESGEYYDESFKGGHFMCGFRWRAGAQYKVYKEHSVFAEFSQSFYGLLNMDKGFMGKGVQSHHDIGVGIQFVFD